MTYPRAHLIDRNGGIYHLHSRCVRRAWLCGRDPMTGRNYDHRRRWLEQRIIKLSEVFAIDLYGYAVMSNHIHLVINLDADRTKEWDDSTIADKWLQLTSSNPKQKQFHRTLLLSNPDRLLEIRERLGSASWFMRYLKEPLARFANKEDDCTGRFWEGRFKSQRLLDADSILACMVYVDLNPLRAGEADDPTSSRHTSLFNRLQSHRLNQPLETIGKPHRSMPFEHSLAEYIELTKWTALSQASARPIPQKPSTVKLPINQTLWLTYYLPEPGTWQRARGSITNLGHYADELGLKWIRTSPRRAA